jgi:DNA polymerase-3 subunit gamma/tau
LDYDYYFRLTDLILNEDVAGCLVLFDEVLNKGFDGHHFITGLGTHVRNLLVCKDAQTIPLLEVSESIGEKYKVQAANADLRLLIQTLQLVNECDTQYRSSKHQRLLVELTLMKIASILYNQREGEKKKFKLKPFRSNPKPAAVSQRQINPIQPEISSAAKAAEPSAAIQPKPAITALGKKSLILQSKESVSIKNVMHKSSSKDNTTTEEEVAVKEKPTREYTTSELREAWSNFTDDKLGHNMQVQGSFRVAEIDLKPGNLLRIAFPSVTQEMYFNDYRSQLAEFMRDRYDIRGIDFQVEILRPEEIKATYQTAKQRFDTLVQKNPSLENLRKRFNLQIDF